jgi:multidrug resistance efflux pump
MGILVVGLFISAYTARQAPRVEAETPPARVKLSPEEERVAKVKLNQAATQLERVRELYAQNLVSEQELNLAKFNADLRRAELLGDAQQAARIRLAYAEEEFKRASELRKQNLIGESEYNEKKNALELQRVLAEQALKSGSAERSTRP